MEVKIKTARIDQKSTFFYFFVFFFSKNSRCRETKNIKFWKETAFFGSSVDHFSNKPCYECFSIILKVAGRIFLRINFFIDTTQPTFQPRINVVSRFRITLEITLIRRWKWKKIRNRIFIVAQHSNNVGVKRWNNVKSTMHIVDATVSQNCTTLFQRCFNDDLTLSQRCFKMASTSFKAILKPIWLMKSIDMQKDR